MQTKTIPVPVIIRLIFQIRINMTQVCKPLAQV